MDNRRTYLIVDEGGGFHKGNIFSEIVSFENLLAAWREFKRGKMKKIEMQNFAFNLEDHLFSLQEELQEKNYRPGGYDFFFVNDPKLRPIHKASVRDGVLFQAVFRILYHIFDRKFIHDSYACRFEKGTHKGIERFNIFAKKVSKNYRHQAFVLKCDIQKFFYSIDHAILLDLIRGEIDDMDVIDLIERIIASFSIKPGKGLPLGNVTSQLFANVYLNELDQYVKHILKEKYYIRYCDDFIILNTDKNHLVGLIPKLNVFLNDHLALHLHPNKIQIRKLSQGIDFLGYVSLPHYQVLRTKTKKRMFRNIRRKLSERETGTINDFEFNQTLQSYFGQLRHCSSYKVKREIEKLLESKSI